MNFIFDYKVPTFLVKFLTINNSFESRGTVTKQNTPNEPKKTNLENITQNVMQN